MITFLTLFLKLRDLQGKVATACVDSWFQILIVLFTKEYFWIPDALIFIHEGKERGSVRKGKR